MHAAGSGESMGISHNTSVSGILIAAATTLATGTPVTVSFKPTQGSTQERKVTGRVLRVMDNTEDPFGIWPHRIAIEFDEVQPDLARVLEASGQRI